MSQRSEQRCRADFQFAAGVSPTPLQRRASDYWKAQAESPKPLGMDRTEKALLIFVLFVLGAVALACLRMAFN